MESSTVSSKYQVVIPKALRKKVDIRPGQKVYVRVNSHGKLVVDTSSALDDAYGSMKGAWGPDSGKALRQLRDEADRDRN